MNSSSPVVKIDTLQTLTACATNYGPQTIDLYAASIWDTIRFEILNANDEDVSNRGLELLRAITQSLSFGLRDAASNTPLGKFLKVVTDACIKELKDTEAKSAKPAGKILAECASVSPASNRFIIEKTVPVLILLFRETNSVNKRTAILEILNGLLDSTKGTVEKDTEQTSLLALTDDLFEVYSKGLLGSTSQEATYKLTALDGFKKLLTLPGVLATNEVGIIVQYFNDIVLRDENEETW
jgi:DNA repair/transcription protein MET18/MMS19